MQDYLRGKLERLASRPSLDQEVPRIAERKDLAPTYLAAEEVLAARGQDRS